MVPRFPQLALGAQSLHFFILRIHITHEQQAFRHVTRTHQHLHTTSPRPRLALP